MNGKTGSTQSSNARPLRLKGRVTDTAVLPLPGAVTIGDAAAELTPSQLGLVLELAKVLGTKDETRLRSETIRINISEED